MATENGPASRDSKLNDTTTSVIKSVRRLSANAMSISTSVSSLQLDVDSMQVCAYTNSIVDSNCYISLVAIRVSASHEEY